MASDDCFEPFRFLQTGAVIQSWHVGDVNIELGFPTEELYKSHNDYYFGATLGRVANRIEGAKFTNLNGGRTYSLPANEGRNTLHAGINSWGHQRWEGPEKVASRKIRGLGEVQGEQSLRFSLRSEDGDEGFPGTVLASVVYTAGWQMMASGGRPAYWNWSMKPNSSVTRRKRSSIRQTIRESLQPPCLAITVSEC